MDGRSARLKAATYTQNNTNTEYMHTDIHVWNGVRTHDSSFRAGEGGSCLRSQEPLWSACSSHGDRNSHISRMEGVKIKYDLINLHESYRINVWVCKMDWTDSVDRITFWTHLWTWACRMTRHILSGWIIWGSFFVNAAHGGRIATRSDS
jgi:hypothetical protein